MSDIEQEPQEQQTQLYVSPIANPIAPPKLEKKILKLTKKCKYKIVLFIDMYQKKINFRGKNKRN